MRTLLLAALLPMTACAPDDPAADDTSAEADADTDTDTDTDTDSDTDTDTDTDTDVAALSWVEDVYRPFLEESCSGCHQDPGYIHPPISEDPDHIVGAESFNGMHYVTPGSLEDSYLWLKVNDLQGDSREAGTRMPPPPDEEPLTAPALAAIEAWILGGALP